MSELKEEDVEEIKTYIKEEKEKKISRGYANLISYALLSLFMGITFWYSARKMDEVSIDLNFMGSGILKNASIALWIGVVLSVIFFLVFVVAIIFKKYGLYEKYFKRKEKSI